MAPIWWIASANAHKIREIRKFLDPFALQLKNLSDLTNSPELVENENTFLGNARSKAWILAKHTQEVCIADDSGIEVDALGGAPGVISARYAGESKKGNSSDVANNEKLLRELKDTPADKRGAQYRCVIVVADPKSGKEWVTEGTCRGVIGEKPQGKGGFGYDPLFYLPQLQRTMAEIDLDLKNTLSHRGEALRKLVEIMPQVLQET